MKNLTLDELTMDEVLNNAARGINRDYWLRIAETKLREYCELMPKLDRFLDADKRGQWPVRAAAWQCDMNSIRRHAVNA